MFSTKNKLFRDTAEMGPNANAEKRVNTNFSRAPMRCHSLSSSATFLSLAFGFWHKGKNVLTLFHTSMTKMFQFYTHAKAATPVRTTNLKSWFRLKISNFAVCAFWYTYGRGRHILNSYAQITFNKRIPDKMCGYTKCKNERELDCTLR